MSSRRFLVFIMLLFSGFIQAQLLYLGGGVNGYRISNPDSDNSSFMRRGYQIGADVMLGSSFYFRGGVHLMGSESGLEYDLDDQTISGSLQFTQLRVPVQIGLEVLDLKAITVFAQTGIAGHGILSIREDEGMESLSEEVRRLQWGWIISAGVRLRFIEASLSYDLGLSNVFKDPAGSSGSRHGLLQLSIGFVL
jgi:hypothetical protein